MKSQKKFRTYTIFHCQLLLNNSKTFIQNGPINHSGQALSSYKYKIIFSEEKSKVNAERVQHN